MVFTGVVGLSLTLNGGVRTKETQEAVAASDIVETETRMPRLEPTQVYLK